MPVDPKALTNAVAYVSYAALSLHPSLRGKIFLLLTALAEAQRDTAEMVEAFRHMHRAHYRTEGDRDILTDECESCGLDILHPLHHAKTALAAPDTPKEQDHA